MKAPKKQRTLADCSVPIHLRCCHCNRELPNSANLELYASYVVVECPKCRCMTPFKLEKSA